MTGLTNRQTEILSFLEERQEKRIPMPTIKEIGKRFGFKSPATVQQHLRLIEQKGYLSRTPRQSRSIRLKSDAYGGSAVAVVKVPLLGRIPAGPPIYALEFVEDKLTLPKNLFHGSGLFALRVQGDSMTGAGIFDGDIAVLSSRSNFMDGAIAAVIVNEEVALKRVYRLPGALRLHSENEKYPDRVVNVGSIDACRMAGILVGTIRQF